MNYFFSQVAVAVGFRTRLTYKTKASSGEITFISIVRAIATDSTDLCPNTHNTKENVVRSRTEVNFFKEPCHNVINIIIIIIVLSYIHICYYYYYYYYIYIYVIGENITVCTRVKNIYQLKN